MFARRRKGPQAAQTTGCEGSGADLAQTGPERERRRLLQSWRRSEQRVMRTWHAWLAATSDDQAERYRAYLGALAEEEAAALAVQCASRPVLTPARDATADVAESPPR